MVNAETERYKYVPLQVKSQAGVRIAAYDNKLALTQATYYQRKVIIQRGSYVVHVSQFRRLDTGSSASLEPKEPLNAEFLANLVIKNFPGP